MSVKKKPIRLANVPVQVPIPMRIRAIQDKEQWKQAVREWWYGDGKSSYATRYEGYRVIRIEQDSLYMERDE